MNDRWTGARWKTNGRNRSLMASDKDGLRYGARPPRANLLLMSAREWGKKTTEYTTQIFGITT